MIAMHVNSLGKNAIENRFSEAQEKIRTIVYSGEKSRWNWDRYVLEMKKCHEERYALVIHGHADLTDREKVYYLIKGIKTPDLEATVTLIESSPDHREDFDAAQLLLTEAVRRANARKLTRNVSMRAPWQRDPRTPRSRPPPPIMGAMTATLLVTTTAVMTCRASSTATMTSSSRS